MKLTYFANWKSCLRTLVLTMMVIVAVLAVKPATVQAKASDYTQDTEGWIEACQKVGRDLTKYNFHRFPHVPCGSCSSTRRTWQEPFQIPDSVGSHNQETASSQN